jgi:integrase
MFETLYDCPSTVARHRRGPMLEERERYLSHLVAEGWRRPIMIAASHTLVTTHLVSRVPDGPITVAAIEEFAASWVRRKHWKKSARKKLVRSATRWLRFIGRLEEPAPTELPFADLRADFSEALRQRELAPATVARLGYTASYFLNWLGQKNRSFSSVSLEDVDAYVAEKSSANWNRRTTISHAEALIAFFRHAGERGWCSPAIAKGIEPPCLYRHESLPIGPSWEQVQQVIETANTASPVDVRDRAILMLLAVYGLRKGEVGGLRLEDIDWDNELLSVRRPKVRRSHQYPLTRAVGDAVLRYLQEVRPRSPYREIFLTLTAPSRPLSPARLYWAVRRYMDKLGIDLPHRGPHSLRHACATRLLREGFSIEDIGRQLGHRSVDATQIYAKVDLVGLREVARFDLGGLL